MNLMELKEWANGIFAKSNDELLAMGVNSRHIPKVRSCARQGIVDRCNIILVQQEKHQSLEEDILDFLSQMGKFGAPYPPFLAEEMRKKEEKKRQEEEKARENERRVMEALDKKKQEEDAKKQQNLKQQDTQK